MVVFKEFTTFGLMINSPVSLLSGGLDEDGSIEIISSALFTFSLRSIHCSIVFFFFFWSLLQDTCVSYCNRINLPRHFNEKNCKNNLTWKI